MNKERQRKKHQKQLLALERAIHNRDLRTLKTLTHLPEFADGVHDKYSNWLEEGFFPLCEFALPYLTNFDCVLVAALILDKEHPHNPLPGKIIKEYVRANPKDQYLIDFNWLEIIVNFSYFGNEDVMQRFVQLCENETAHQQAQKISTEVPKGLKVASKKM